MRKEYDSYLVTDEDLLYRLASCSLLDKLCGVAASKKVEGTRVWFFDKDQEVLNVIRQYQSEKRQNQISYSGVTAAEIAPTEVLNIDQIGCRKRCDVL